MDRGLSPPDYQRRRGSGGNGQSPFNSIMAIPISVCRKT